MNGGIQQSQELAQPNQLLEASNVWWTDNGAFQQRPGLLFENNICLAKDMSLMGASEEDAAEATKTLIAIQSVSNGVKGLPTNLLLREQQPINYSPFHNYS